MIVSVSVEWDTSSSAFRHVSKLGVVVHAILGRNGGCRGARAEGSYLLVAFCDWTPMALLMDQNCTQTVTTTSFSDFMVLTRRNQQKGGRVS